MPRKSDEEGYFEIGRSHVVTMQHVDNGETETVTKVGVNEEPTFRASALSKKVAGMTVRVLAKEDNRVVEGSQIQFASKKVKQVEDADGAGSVSSPVGTPHTFASAIPSGSEEKPSGLQVLKNMVDKVADRLNIELPQLHKWDKIAIGLAAFGVAMAIAAFAIGLSLLH
jgi:hypothetical protein